MKAVLIVLGLWFFWFIRDIVAIFVASILLSALIDPFASWFAARKIPRGLAVIIVYTLLLAITSVFIVALVPIISEQGTDLFANVSFYYQEAAESLGQFRQFSGNGGFAESIVTSIESLQSEITSSFGSLFSTVKGVIGGIAASFIILVLAFYMVVEEERMSHYFKKLAPVEYRPYISQLLKKMQNKMGQWLRAQLILGLVVGIAVYIGLKILGVEYALLLALIAGVLEIVPYLGPILAVVPALMIGLAQSPIIGLSVLGLYLLIQQVENNILVPKIMQTVTGLNPVISILALLVGLKAGGIAGAILAIPLAMMAVVILEDLFRDVTE
jgi:predicted PurR-regulated permease PerM